MTDPFIELKNVTKTYYQGDTPVKALDQLDLKIPKGEFIAITGKSGCGKSTLVNIVGGLDSPDRGQVFINGEDITRMDDRRLTLFRRDKMGIIFQFFNLLPILTIEENIALPHLLKEGSNTIEAHVDQLLRQMGLFDRRNHRPHELSGGEMQRVAICRALINDPEIILADEPTGNLDSSTGRQVLETLRRLKEEQGKTILLVTHSQEGAAIADRILRMQDGRLLSI
ncbi:MAG TPA: ABC transporter ATP-binding protein [Thermodesulfobacteriota bacterium]|nr:ABC transporter ATP-binding protein [Thermodesulfobacteriota bacterium]